MLPPWLFPWLMPKSRWPMPPAPITNTGVGASGMGRKKVSGLPLKASRYVAIEIGSPQPGHDINRFKGFAVLGSVV
jgi:hypothetical protein